MDLKEIKLEYKFKQPPSDILNFVDKFYCIKNPTSSEKKIVVIPDGSIDIFYIIEENGSFSSTLIGLETQPTKAFFPPKCTFIGVSLKLLAVEYILQISIAEILNSAKELPKDFWGITHGDAANFEQFCKKIIAVIRERNNSTIDIRKQNLFSQLYQTNGSLTVKEYSQKSIWTERQINRYFNSTFGLSLKSVCSLLRFRASLVHLKAGKLFPEQNYFDQAHFINEVKKLTKCTPKELAQNENDRFLQLSAIRRK
jgi:AraC-like DNA-binding protein